MQQTRQKIATFSLMVVLAALVAACSSSVLEPKPSYEDDEKCILVNGRWFCGP
jgi:hypothetical protein